jgi:hypothetical protein
MSAKNCGNSAVLSVCAEVARKIPQNDKGRDSKSSPSPDGGLALLPENAALEAFFVLKQAKEHGSQERTEEGLPTAARVAVVEDMLTTGGSVRQEVQEIERAGGQVVAVVRIVDRLEEAREAFAPKYD